MPAHKFWDSDSLALLVKTSLVVMHYIRSLLSSSRCVELPLISSASAIIQTSIQEKSMHIWKLWCTLFSFACCMLQLMAQTGRQVDP